MLRALLETHEGWQVCGEAENGLEAVAKANELRPDVIILDLAMPVMDGLRATREICKALPGIPVLIHTLHNAPGLDLESKKAGVSKIINKTDAADHLISAIEEVLDKARTVGTACALGVAASPEVKAAVSGSGNGSTETPSANEDLNGGAKPN
jgi:DNA-binding NarL/FixJ family response regulator